MGNIISDTSGTINQKISDTSFAKNINDILLELDLYSVDSKLDKATSSSLPAGTRTNYEMDYTVNGISSRTKINGNLVDIQGIPYNMDNDQTPSDGYGLGEVGQNLNTNNTNLNYWKNFSKYYNVKRAVCNATFQVPVNTIGSMYPTLTTVQQSKVDSCLIEGKINGATSNESYLGKIPHYLQWNWGGNFSAVWIYESKNIDSIIDRSGINLATGLPNNPGGLDSLGELPDNLRTKTSPYYYSYRKPFFLNTYNAQYLSTNCTSLLDPLYYPNPDDQQINDAINDINNNLYDYKYHNKNPDYINLKDDPDFIGFYIVKNPNYTNCNDQSNDVPYANPQYATIAYPIMRQNDPTYTNKYSNATDAFNDLIDNNIVTLSPYGAFDVTTPKPINVDAKIIGTIPNGMNYAIILVPPTGYTKTTNTIGYYTEEYINKFIIPDIDLTKDTLNMGTTNLANSTVYGNPMSDECNELLNNTLTNSYIKADLTKYTKLNSKLDPSITSGLKPGFTGQSLITSRDGDILFVDSGNASGTNKFFNTSNQNGAVYNVINPNIIIGSNTNTATNTSSDCGNFYSQLCNYYYYYDFRDGITYNPDILDKLLNPDGTVNQSLNTTLSNNVGYLAQHIPDCRCINNLSNRTNDPAMLDAANKSGADSAIQYLYLSNKCRAVSGSSVEYGLNTNGGEDQYRTTSKTISGIINNIAGIFGFGTQIDPSNQSVSGTQMSDNRFLYAGDARGKPTISNIAICNMTTSISVSGVGGNATIAGINPTCNISQNTSGGSSAPPISGTGLSPLPSILKNKPTLSVTINTPPVNLVDYTKPVDALQPLQAILVLDPAYTFYTGDKPNYGFAFQAVNNPASILFGNYTCGSGLSAGLSATLCNQQTKFNILTPFVYGKTTNEYGINYNLFIQNLPGNNTNTIIPSTPIPIILKQYAMQITDVIPGDFGLSLRFNIQFKCISRPSIPYVVILTPVTPSAVNVPVTITGTDFFQDVIAKKGLNQGQSPPPINSLLADGFLLIGPNSTEVSPIKPTNYTYKILLNPTVSNATVGQVTYSGGNIMNFSINVPSNYNGTNSAIDFGNFVSAFNNTTISYIDINNNNQVTLFPSSNLIATFGATLVLNWSFTNRDKYTGFNINYIVGSSQPVNIAQVGITEILYEFIMPITITGQKISFYIEAYGSTSTPLKSNLKSQLLSITSVPVPTSPAVFNGFNILTNPIIESTNTFADVGISGLTIYDYLNGIDLAKSNGDNAIIYDYISNKWNTGVVSNTTSSPSTTSTTIAFQLPTNIPTMTFTLSNNKSDRTSTIIGTGSTIQIGAILTITWILSAGFKADTQVQINLYGIVYDTFIISAGKTTGTYQFTLYDLTGGLSSNTTTLQLTYLRTSPSSITGLTIQNPFINTTTNPSTTSNSLTLSSINPLVYISPNSVNPNKNAINNLNITLTNPLNDNVYFNVFNGYESPLSINTQIMELQNVNYSKPIKINFTNISIGNFTNVVYDKLRKSKKEHFGNIAEGSTKKKLIEGLSGNILIANILRLDLSQTNFTNSAIVNYIFNNYSNVSIQSLELYFGTTNIDNSTLNISFSGNLSPFNIEIGSVRIIGIMTSKLFFPVPIPGATEFYYSTNTQGANSSWESSFTLINNNDGYFSINSNDSKAVSDANYLILNPSSSSSSLNAPSMFVLSDNTEETNWLLYGGIAAVLIILAVVIYFMFLSKPNKK